jgi:uncharacterized protein
LRVYLDSCLVIYLLEGGHGLPEKVRDALTDSPRTLCVSGLVRMECLVGAFKQGSPEVLNLYRQFFLRLESLAVSEAAFDLAAELRATTGLSLPDALHLAVSELNGCDEFWTADTHFIRANPQVKTRVRMIA